jgi:hypothetical protein
VCGIEEINGVILENIYLLANHSSYQVRRYFRGNPNVNNGDVFPKLAN